MRTVSYRGFRFPPSIIQHAIWLYVRFGLSLRNVQDLLAERGIEVSYKTVRCWIERFGPAFAKIRLLVGEVDLPLTEAPFHLSPG